MNVPETSSFCREDSHERCPHWYGLGSDYVRLCRCACHTSCPVRGKKVSRELLRENCTCAGAPEWRVTEEKMKPHVEERRREFDRTVAQRREKVRAATASVERRPGASEADYRAKLARAYEERGIEPAAGELDLAAGTMCVSTGPPGLRTVQYLRVIGRWLSHLSKIGNSPEDSDGPAA
jgi:hypothetical protein